MLRGSNASNRLTPRIREFNPCLFQQIASLQKARKAAGGVTHTTPIGQISCSSVHINAHHFTAAVSVDTQTS